MAQRTLVYLVPQGEQRALRSRLPAVEFEFRPVPHAVFSAKGGGVVATLYASGKLVVQGAEPEWFAERFLAGARPRPAKSAGELDAASPSTRSGDPCPPDGSAAAAGARIGSDECGKGDYFGPLVVCAVCVSAEEWRALRGGRVGDSKDFSDRAAREVGAALRANVRHCLRVLDPVDYNRVWGASRNVNRVLADLHASAIRELLVPGAHVVVDRFASGTLLRDVLGPFSGTLEERPRAEDDPAVGAASLIAREEFLTRLDALSQEYAVDLHKGAGAPTDAAGRRFVALHGVRKLGMVAKLHFKNTARVAPGGGPGP